LTDAHELAHVTGALEVMGRATDAVSRYLPGRAVHREESNTARRTNLDESYTLPENLFRAWSLTGERRYLDMAQSYLFDGPYFDPLARGENVLPGRHAYSHVN